MGTNTLTREVLLFDRYVLQQNLYESLVPSLQYLAMRPFFCNYGTVRICHTQEYSFFIMCPNSKPLKNFFRNICSHSRQSGLLQRLIAFSPFQALDLSAQFVCQMVNNV